MINSPHLWHAECTERSSVSLRGRTARRSMPHDSRDFSMIVRTIQVGFQSDGGVRKKTSLLPTNVAANTNATLGKARAAPRECAAGRHASEEAAGRSFDLNPLTLATCPYYGKYELTISTRGQDVGNFCMIHHKRLLRKWLEEPRWCAKTADERDPSFHPKNN